MQIKVQRLIVTFVLFFAGMAFALSADAARDGGRFSGASIGVVQGSAQSADSDGATGDPDVPSRDKRLRIVDPSSDGSFHGVSGPRTWYVYGRVLLSSYLSWLTR